MAGKRLWGNALGGYKFQNRKGGKFASGFGMGYVPGGSKKRGKKSTNKRVSKGQRRYQEFKKAERRQKIKKVATRAATAGAVAGAAYGAYKVNRQFADAERRAMRPFTRPMPAKEFATMKYQGAKSGTVEKAKKATESPQAVIGTVATINTAASHAKSANREVRRTRSIAQRSRDMKRPVAVRSGGEDFVGAPVTKQQRKNVAKARSTVRRTVESRDNHYDGGDYMEDPMYNGMHTGRSARGYAKGMAPRVVRDPVETIPKPRGKSRSRPQRVARVVDAADVKRGRPEGERHSERSGLQWVPVKSKTYARDERIRNAHEEAVADQVREAVMDNLGFRVAPSVHKPSDPKVKAEKDKRFGHLPGKFQQRLGEDKALKAQERYYQGILFAEGMGVGRYGQPLTAEFRPRTTNPGQRRKVRLSNGKFVDYYEPARRPMKAKRRKR